MENNKSIFEIIEETYQMIVNEIYKNPDKMGIELLYISDTYNGFNENLYNKYGITKDEIIKHITFEIYSEFLQEDYRINFEKLSLSDFLKKTVNDLSDSDFRNITKNKVKPYIKKYSYLYFDNDMCGQDKIKIMVPLWERLTHYRSMFPREGIESMFNLEQNNGKYSISEFQSYLYSYIICNYTQKNKIVAKLFGMNFSKVDCFEYIEFISSLIESCRDEDHKNILYYFIEKEFSPILIANAINRLNKFNEGIEDEVVFRTINNLWYASLTPFTTSSNKYYDKMKEEMNSMGELQKKYNRYPTTLVIGLLRLHKEFLPVILNVVYQRLKDIFKERMNYVFKENEKEILKIYSELEIKVKESIETLRSKESEPLFQILMFSKEKVYKEIENLVSLIEIHDDKIVEYCDTKDENVLLETIYLKEDIKSIVANNIYLKILNGNNFDNF
ncbi:hypothetical protein ACLM5H_08640 [Fredinandcohnia humi]